MQQTGKSITEEKNLQVYQLQVLVLDISYKPTSIGPFTQYLSHQQKLFSFYISSIFHFEKLVMKLYHLHQITLPGTQKHELRCG